MLKFNLLAVGGLALTITPAFADPCNAPLPKKGETFSGKVTYIVDGDGLCVGHEQGGIEVRLGDFNAPELKDAGGQEAKDALRRLVFGKDVECLADHRSYDRIVAICTFDNMRLGILMQGEGIKEGGRGAQ